MSFKPDTSGAFVPGKLTFLLDCSFGSSGKGKLADYLVKHANGACNFMLNVHFSQASHTVIDNGKSYVYKQLNSAAHRHWEFEKMYIGQGAVITVDELLKEIEMAGLPTHKLGISPLCAIVQTMDMLYEKGECGFDGELITVKHSGTIGTGSTCSGVGAARARKVLRRPNLLIARDIEALKPYLCDVPGEIMERLDRGQSGLFELAQGFPLSYGLPQFYPNTTSRNITVAAALDDAMLPPIYAGPVFLNLRTFPIRIHSYKYLSLPEEKVVHTIDLSNSGIRDEMKADGVKFKRGQTTNDLWEDTSVTQWLWEQTKEVIKRYNLPNVGYRMKAGNPDIAEFFYTEPGGRHLYWSEVQAGVPHQKIDSYSGDFYPDQREMTWEELTIASGSEKDIMETTTLTKLPRRVATFSKENLVEAIRYNQTGYPIYLALNFVNYVDARLENAKENGSVKLNNWLAENIKPVLEKFPMVDLAFLGTGADTDAQIVVSSPNQVAMSIKMSVAAVEKTNR